MWHRWLLREKSSTHQFCGGDAAAQKSCRELDKTNNSFHCRLVLLFCFYCIDPIGLDLLGAATSPLF